MPATLTIRDQFIWDPDRLQYRRPNGQFVSVRAVKLGIRRVIRATQAEMQSLTNQMMRGELSLSDWQARFTNELKNMHVSAAMAGQGGAANMTRNDYLRVGRALKSQYRYLDRFVKQIKAGELSPSRIAARSNMYVNGMNGSYEDGRQSSAIAAGYDEVRNVLSLKEKHCHTGVRVGCPELSQQGWVAIGTMPVPGQRQCLSGCGCALKFRKRKAD